MTSAFASQEGKDAECRGTCGDAHVSQREKKRRRNEETNGFSLYFLQANEACFEGGSTTGEQGGLTVGSPSATTGWALARAFPFT